jgi:Ca-activated chloride channel family protein
VISNCTGRIHAGGNTDLHGGWLEGAQTLTAVPGSGLKRVIVLSDGQANEGLTDAAAISGQCAQWAARGVTTSTYGLGNSFNEELMVAMARANGGNHYYGDTAEDLMDPFQQELELLGNLCLRDLRMSARARDGVEVEMVNVLPAAEGGWRLPDLAWGAQAWAVLRLKVPMTALTDGREDGSAAGSGERVQPRRRERAARARRTGAARHGADRDRHAPSRQTRAAAADHSRRSLAVTIRARSLLLAS